MHTHLRSAVFSLIFLVSPVAIFADQQVELFNGKDLTGWTKRGGNATYRVENGEIVGQSAPNTTNTFLCTNKEFGDIEMEVDFKIDPKDNVFNSGVQIRSHARPEKDKKSGKDSERVYGYQVEIDTKADRPWTGGIYFEGGIRDKNGKLVMRGENGWMFPLKDNKAAQNQRHLGEWNHLKIVAKGRHIQTWLNGVPAADLTDNDKKYFTPKGFIALQVHAVGKLDDTREVRFKNIKFTPLD
jgi:hypothetical protein